MKSVQFLQSLNLPVGLTYISFPSLAALPDFVVHFLPMSERLSPKTTTVSILSGIVPQVPQLSSNAPLVVCVFVRPSSSSWGLWGQIEMCSR